MRWRGEGGGWSDLRATLREHESVCHEVTECDDDHGDRREERRLQPPGGQDRLSGRRPSRQASRG